MFARLAFMFHQRVGVGEEGCFIHNDMVIIEIIEI
jgi:hypothetical protein